ncbi:MAG TPA: YSC84-related protein [Syntrophales bacterium]|nr:YSC84-related protein [Syntrophales bacterium]
MKRNGRYAVLVVAIAVLCLGLAACATAPVSQSQKAEQQNDVRNMSKTALSLLYEKYPGTRDVIAKAKGYAVFSDFGFKIMFGGGAQGAGIAIDNATQRETFMKMIELRPGLGVGAEKFYLVLVFNNAAAFNDFLTSGWDIGADAMATAKVQTTGADEKGGVSLSDGVDLYQLSDQGVIIGISITGTKFYKDDDLN